MVEEGVSIGALRMCSPVGQADVGFAVRDKVTGNRTHPMKFGNIVHDRACVLIGTWSSSACRKLGNATK